MFILNSCHAKLLLLFGHAWSPAEQRETCVCPLVHILGSMGGRDRRLMTPIRGLRAWNGILIMWNHAQVRKLIYRDAKTVAIIVTGRLLPWPVRARRCPGAELSGGRSCPSLPMIITAAWFDLSQFSAAKGINNPFRKLWLVFESQD
jgi:hypothetical protein